MPGVFSDARVSTLKSYLLPLPISDPLAPTDPVINNQEILIRGRKIWFKIDKPYYPITPVQNLNIISDPVITVKFNTDTAPAIPVDLNNPIVTDFDRIYVTCYLSRPRYWDAINFSDIERCNIIIYYSDWANENIQIARPNLVRYSMYLARTVIINPLIPGDNWFYIPFANLPYIKFLEGYFLPFINAPGGVVPVPGDLTLMIFDDNVIQDNYVLAGGSLNDLKYPLLWQPQPTQIALCQDDMYPFHPRAININVGPNATADSIYFTMKGIII